MQICGMGGTESPGVPGCPPRHRYERPDGGPAGDVYPPRVTLDQSVRPRCNIGPAEIARRRVIAWVLTAVAAAVSILFLAIDTPPAARLLVWPFSTAAAVTWLQVFHRFCVHFGFFGLENLGRPGDHERVDPGIRAADRRRALEIILEGGLLGLAVAFVLVALPI